MWIFRVHTVKSSVVNTRDRFREPAIAKARTGYATENLATLRRLALNLLRKEKTKKRGTRAGQLNAGWDHACLPGLLEV
jgi:hypothetical protein